MMTQQYQGPKQSILGHRAHTPTIGLCESVAKFGELGLYEVDELDYALVYLLQER